MITTHTSRRVLSLLLLLTAFAVATTQARNYNKDPLRIAFAYVGPVSDIGWTFAHNEGRVAIEDAFGSTVQTTAFENVPEDPKEGHKAFREMATSGYDMIVGTSFGFQDPMFELSKEKQFDHIHWLHISGFLAGPKFSNAFARMYQARFLSGIAAGMATKNNKVGFVAAFQIPEVYRGVNSFNIGMKLGNPKATLHVVWTDTWVDPDLEKYAADFLLDDVGVDVITQDQDTFTPQLEANARGKFSVGYNTDMGKYVSSTVLTSAMWNWGPMYVDFVQTVLDDTWIPYQSYWGDFGQGLADIGKFSVLMEEKSKKLILKQRQKLLNGGPDVFCGKAAKEWNPEGENNCLTDIQLLTLSSTRSDIVDEGYIAIPLSQVDIDDAYTITMQVLAGIVIAMVMGIMVGIVLFRNHLIIRYSSPIFCLASCAGSIMILVTVFLISPTPDADVLCSIPVWTATLGFTLFYGNLMAKMFRVYLIFRGMDNFKAISVKDKQIIPIVVALLAVDCLLLTLFTAIDTPDASKDKYPDDDLDRYEYRWVCDYNGAAEVMIFIILGWKCCQIVGGLVLAFLTRGVSKAFRESSYVVAALYTFIFGFVVLVPLVAILDDVTAVYVVVSLTLIFVNLIAVSVLFAPKFYWIATGKERMATMVSSTMGARPTLRTESGSAASPRSDDTLMTSGSASSPRGGSSNARSATML
eukprot:TRINITY_DN6809_c0_g1_i1.p1 TRINITY_DN6809_c0_g1~~TRINITY_DN6809_c0_g1_i1.p1  ORF type:complete len:708 (+),score=155.45 TRINITY_DN6809_c0_g1_i1:41-2125(+)